jgi:GntR family transcriptional regulator
MALPLYQQIADDLAEQIRSGKLTPGSQLLTELELREQYNASRNTIRDAIKRLISIGLVETKPGQGTFVVQKIDPFVTTLTGSPFSGGQSDWVTTYLSEVAEQHRRANASLPRVEVQAAQAPIALRLRIAPGSQVVLRHEERFIDEIPWSLQTTFYPMEFVTVHGAPKLLIAESIDGGAVKYLETVLDIRQVGYRDWVTARNPDVNEQVFFRIEHDATVFEVFRTSFDQKATPIRVTVTVYPADRNQFIINVGDVPPPQYGAEGAT